MPMRRRQTILVMLAMFAAAGALFPWADEYRFICAGLAFVLIALVAIGRVRAHYEQLTKNSGADETLARVQRIREERAKRFSR